MPTISAAKGATTAMPKWVYNVSYQDRQIARDANFRWDRERKAWWTCDPAIIRGLPQDLDDSAKDLLAAIDSEVHASRNASPEDLAFDVPLPSHAPGQLYDYQRAGIAYASRRERAIFGDEMGLGKTPQAIGCLNVWGITRGVLIVCPASLKLNWERELRRWYTGSTSIRIVSKSKDKIDETADVVIVNYDLIHRKGVKEQLDRRWDAVIFDEAHYLKTPDSKRTKTALGDNGQGGIVSRAGRVLLLTGTPIPNRPIEAFPLLRAVARPVFGSNKHAFAVRYCGAWRGKWGWDYTGATNLAELQEKMRQTCLVRRLKADVLTELPPKTLQLISLEANAHARRLVSAEKKAIASLEKEGKAIDWQAMGGLELGEIATLRRETAEAKVPAITEYVEGILEEQEQVVVFAHHRDVLTALEDSLAEYGVVTITGGTPQAQRQQAVDDFQAGKARVFLGNIVAAGVGITLIAASHIVMAELDWVPGNVQQAIDRCHRIGQESNVTAHLLVYRGTLEENLAEALCEKADVQNRALDKN